MLPVGLSFQQAPPISVSFRFFISAPLFMLAAAMLLIFDDQNLMVTRHSPAALAATHLITLGFTSMVMCGALLQLLPVLFGIVLPHPIRTAWLLHLPLTLGAAGIAGAFLWNLPWLMFFSMACLVITFGSLLFTLATNLWRVPAQESSRSAMRMALVALAVAVCLGLILGMARHIPLPVPYKILADLHPLWGLYGWTTLLIMGTAYQLVPMFQLTRNYPALITRRLVGFLLMCIAVRTLVAWIPGPVGDGLARLVDASLAAGALLFSIVTLRLQWQRKRKVGDTTLNFWQIGMWALLLSAVMGFLLQILIGTHSETLRQALVVLALMGFAVAVINGMLYKIVPFLTWFHLQSAYPQSKVVPNVRQIQSGFHTRYQMILYLVALVVLMASCWKPSLSRLAGMLWAINALWLERNLMQAVRIFRSVQKLARTVRQD